MKKIKSGYRELSKAVLEFALKDLTNKKSEKRIDAARFFSRGNYKLFCNLAEVQAWAVTKKYHEISGRVNV